MRKASSNQIESLPRRLTKHPNSIHTSAHTHTQKKTTAWSTRRQERDRYQGCGGVEFQLGHPRLTGLETLTECIDLLRMRLALRAQLVPQLRRAMRIELRLNGQTDGWMDGWADRLDKSRSQIQLPSQVESSIHTQQ